MVILKLKIIFLNQASKLVLSNSLLKEKKVKVARKGREKVKRQQLSKEFQPKK
jgi:hypothetical protein